MTSRDARASREAAAPTPSVARHRGGHVGLDVQVAIVADVDHDLDDRAPGELAPWGVLGADGVAPS